MPRLRFILIGLIAVVAAIVVALGAMRFAPSGQVRQALAHSRRLQASGDTVTAIRTLEVALRRFPAASTADEAAMALGALAEAQGDWVKAQQAYQQLIQQLPMSEQIAEAQDALGRVDIALLFSPAIGHQDHLYVVQGGDTLVRIAKQFHTTVEVLRRANQLSSDVIQPGQQLKTPGGAFSILVDKSQNSLLLTRDEEFFKQYRVATGSDNSTPVGTFTIVNKLVDPPWFSDQGVIPADDPRNILGTRWMGFDKPSYGIHGTTDPDSIGRQATAGCVRMRNSDVEELYAIIPEGTHVTIID